jgi:two-component system repressor protein LuxO
MESEIFGHVKGAFSGAISHRDGAATLADGGTLFLDELSEMDISLQSKLLRFIQTGTFQKVGSSQQEQVDIRFISATNRDPLKAIEEKKLREDLYYRLNVISVNLPALKERDNDPYLLATQFLKHFSDKEEKTMAGFSSSAEKLILGYNWPGNVRQLENVVHSAVIMSDGPLVTDKDIAQALGTPLESLLAEIRTSADKQSPSVLSTASTSSSTSASTAELSPAEPSHAFSGLSEGIKPAAEQLPDDTAEEIVPLAKVEEIAIKNAIEQCDGNVVKAASLLEVSPSTLYRKIQSW